MKKPVILSLFLIVLSFFPLQFRADAAVPIGNYLVLKGGYLKASSSFSYSPSAFTFEAWVKPDDVSDAQNILSIGDKVSRNLHYEVGINGASLSFNYRYSTGSQRVVTAGNLVSGSWNHIAVIASASFTRTYVNGVQVLSTTGADNLLSIGENIVIGGSYLESVTGGYNYKGEIDEIRISEKVRDIPSNWAGGIYQSALSADQSTVILWHMDESRGQTKAVDSSVNLIEANLSGGDGKVHFFGVLPTPTQIVLPTSRWRLPVLPTLYFSPRISIYPTATIVPTVPTAPTDPEISRYTRPERPIYPR